MTKIVHIARPIAGVGVYVSLLTKHIGSDFENIIICNKNEKIVNLKDSLDNDLKIYHSEIKREINLIKDFKCLLDILKILRDIKPDIIHCHSAKSGILGRIAGKLLNIKTLYTPHAYSYLSAESTKKKYILKKIEYFFGFFYGYTLACSKSEQNRSINDLKIKKEKVFLWQNSIENKIDVKRTNYLDTLPKNFICSIGRPSYQKNTLLLLKAILIAKKKKNDIHLVILGVGFYSPKLKELEKFIFKNNLTENVTLIPWLNREESMSILEKSLFYISSSRYEGLPYSVIEALAFEKPCILTKVDGNKDLVQNNYNGFLVKESDYEMGAKIIDMLTNKKILNRMSKNSRVLFENFYDIKKNIKLLENLYLNL